MSQRFRKHNTSIALALSVTLDTGENPQPIVEVFIKSDDAATFVISGSSDDSVFRTSQSVVFTGANERSIGAQNAYRYVKVETTALNNNEIEIVATG